MAPPPKFSAAGASWSHWQAGDNVVEQSLPLDPSGVVYDTATRQPVANATVTFNGPPGFDPALHLLGGAAEPASGHRCRRLLSIPAGGRRAGRQLHPHGDAACRLHRAVDATAAGGDARPPPGSAWAACSRCRRSRVRRRWASPPPTTSRSRWRRAIPTSSTTTSRWIRSAVPPARWC